MPLDLVGPVLLFGFAAMITPGPNNVMLLASGANFGFRRTIPHMVGVVSGFTLLLLAVALGLGGLLTAYPTVHLVLKIAGAAYLLYLAYKIAMTRQMGQGEERKSPMTFGQAAAFQWVNPKAWVTGITGLSLFADPNAPVASLSLVVILSGLVSATTVIAWAAFGTVLQDFLGEPRRLKWFNIAMGGLLAASVVPMVS